MASGFAAKQTEQTTKGKLVDSTLYEKYMQLTAVALSDTEWKFQAPTYLFSETMDNQESVFLTGLNLFGSDLVTGIYIIDYLGQKRNNGYPGAKKWKKVLVKYDFIPPDIVVRIPCRKDLNTLTESFAVVRYAKRHGWKTLRIVAPAFHQLRAFISIVTAVRNIGASLRVYNSPGAVLSWTEEATHSQGKLRATRLEFVVEELRRIAYYTQKGDLLGPDKVFDYLRWRDR